MARPVRTSHLDVDLQETEEESQSPLSQARSLEIKMKRTFHADVGDSLLGSVVVLDLVRDDALRDQQVGQLGDTVSLELVVRVLEVLGWEEDEELRRFVVELKHARLAALLERPELVLQSLVADGSIVGHGHADLSHHPDELTSESLHVSDRVHPGRKRGRPTKRDAHLAW